MRRFLAHGLGALVVFSCLACNKSEAATTREHKAAVSNPTGPRAEGDNYIAEIQAKGPYQSGKEATFDVVITAKADYHINDQYPYKFTPYDREGVTYKGPVGRDRGEFERTKAVLHVPFTPTKSGDVSLAGKVHLSVCSDKNCSMEKPELEAHVTVQ